MMFGWETIHGPVRRMILNSRRPAKICTWNVRTMYQSGQTENICREMLKAKIEILAITESRWIKNGEVKHHSGLKILYSGHMNDDAGHNQGVALMLKSKHNVP